MKILLITSKYNYGSLLQCYATIRILKQFGHHCDYVNVDSYSNIFTKLVFKIDRLFHIKKTKSIKPEAYYHNNLFQYEKQKFLKTELREYVLSYADIKSRIKNKYYDKILIGSDQVWNFKNQSKINKTQLQDYKGKNKLVSFASSFGADSINPKHKRKLKKYFNSFSDISIRESDSIRVFEELGLDKEKITILADPVVMLNEAEWKDFYYEKSKLNLNNFVFVHFLGTPSDIAVARIRQYYKNNNCKFIFFYTDCTKYFDFIKDKQIIEGNPYDYLNLIHHSSFVFTDSFHTSQLSIIFKKQFNVFDRIYQDGAAKQNIRIDELIKKFDCKNNYINSLDNFKNSFNQFPKTDIEFWRSKDIDYLKKLFPYETKKIKSIDECVGCGLCASVCKSNAINKISGPSLFSYYKINSSKCVSCNACSTICYRAINHNHYKQIGYASYFDDQLRFKSASGGTFAAISKYILENNGIVFGTKLIYNHGKCKNACYSIDNYQNLTELLKSKYVENDSFDSFPKIKGYLEENRLVLFCSTSCKVDALYKYLNKNYDNLITIDLICHGVPSEEIFNKYIKYLQKKYRAEIIDFEFRKKYLGSNWKWKNNHVETITFKRKDKIFKKEISCDDSPFYKLFLNGEIYRNACYSCSYSSLNKPADLTIGDYYEFESDYPDIFKTDDSIIKNGLNSLIINSQKGYDLIKSVPKYLVLIPVDVKKIQLSHNALCQPTSFTSKRYKALKTIKKFGFRGYVINEKVASLLTRIIKKVFLK